MQGNYSIQHIVVFFLVFAETLSAQHATSAHPSVDRKNAAQRLAKTSVSLYSRFDANRINNIMMNNGQYVSHVVTGNSGMEWPKHSQNLIDFASGIWIAAKSDSNYYTAAAEYASEFQAGKILPNNIPDDPSLSKYRWYKITTADLTNPGSDYLNWPLQDGAPVDGKGRPLLLGDQTLWCVFNDADTAKHQAVFGSRPMALEIQMTVWGYDRTEFWGDMMFVKAKVIHKGSITFDSVFFGLWDDPDLGDASDDYVGCDTILNLGYCWNADDFDQQYGNAPPALGRDFFQGPIVPSPGDTANVSGRKVPGYKNLPMNSFAYYIGGAPYPLQDPSSALEVFRYMSGRFQDGSPFVNPITNEATRFIFSGDPETNTGWTEQNPTLNYPGDRRFLMSSGPFTFAPGDTQEVVFAVLIARGISNVNSVTKLKELSLLAQNVYDRNFMMPELSRSTYKLRPLDGTTTELTVNSEILGLSNITQARLEFRPEVGSEATFSVNLYDDGMHGDDFSSDGVWGNAITIANRKYPYEANLIVQSSSGIDTISRLLGSVQLRPSPRLVNWRVVWENGQQDRKLNSGELVYLAFDIENPDRLNGIDTMRVARRLIFFLDKDTLLIAGVLGPGHVLKSDTLFLIVEQQGSGSSQAVDYFMAFDGHIVRSDHEFPVTTWYPHMRWRDTISVNVVKGVPGRVVTRIADPALLTGHVYLISIYDDTTLSRTAWQLRDQTTGELKLNQGGYTTRWYDAFPVIDGIQFEVSDAIPDFAKFLCVANGTGPLTTPDMAAFALSGSGFPIIERPFPGGNVEVPQIPNVPNGGRWGIHTGILNLSMDPSFDFFKSRVTNDGTNWSRIIPYDFEIRFTASGGKARMDYTSGALVDVPFELWNIGINTPSDLSDDYRMIPFITDVDSNNTFNLVRIDHSISGGTNDPETDWIDFREPLNKTPGQSGYDQWVLANGDTAFVGPEVMGKLVLVNWNGGSVTDSTWPANVNQLMPASGTIYRILSTKPNAHGDSFLLTAPSNANGELVPFALSQNYPNPFNLSTKVRFTVQAETHLSLEVYDLLGRRVRTLRDEPVRPGSYEVEWDGRNETGTAVSSGIYFFRMKTNQYVNTLKMVVVK